MKKLFLLVFTFLTAYLILLHLECLNIKKHSCLSNYFNLKLK